MDILTRLDAPYRGHGEAVIRAVYRQSIDDFRVEEELGFEPDGAGEHWLVHIEKRGLNTADLARDLAEAAAAAAVDIGYAGLKDRHAVTRQWFSLRSPLDIEAIAARLAETRAGERCEILAASRHGRKLRPGAHAGNRFRIVLREVGTAGDGSGDALAGGAGAERDEALARCLDERVAERLALVRRHGFPALIGPQRFGHDGRNLRRAMTSFANRRKRQSRQQRSLQLSSARSAVFNLLLLDRLAAGDWLRLLPGEPAMLAGSRSWFVPKAAERDGMVGRLAELDVHPSGPWWGRGAPVAMDECAERERRVLADDECALLLAGLERAGLDQGRRALRALARELTAEWGPAGELVLNVTLERGVFATSLLRELGECVDLSRSAARSTSASASPGCRAGCDCRADAR